MTIDQLFILVLGVAGVALAVAPSRQLQAYGVLVVLAAQPFWFYATWQAQQLGAFASCFFITAAWCRGLHTYRAELAASPADARRVASLARESLRKRTRALLRAVAQTKALLATRTFTSPAALRVLAPLRRFALAAWRRSCALRLQLVSLALLLGIAR